MKNKTNQITRTYILVSIFLAIIYREVFKHVLPSNPLSFSFINDILFILVSGVLLKYVLYKNDIKNSEIYRKLKNTNNEIKESNERYDIVSKATSDTIWDWKIEEDKMFWNKGIEGVFGYKEDQVGKSSKWWFDNIHPEDTIKMSIKLYSFIEQKTEKWQDQYRFKCADGSYKYVLDRGFILKDEKGRSVRMIGAIQDITKQKEEEQRLKLLETVITHTKDSIIITESNLNEGKIPNIVYVNPAFSLISGYNSDEIIGKSPEEFMGPNSDIKEHEKLVNAIMNKEECQVETLSYKKNREAYWVNFNMLPVYDSEGELSHWVSIQRDITEEKKQEVEKEQLIKELTQNNKDLQQFSYITSHNLRAPLSNLTGLLNLIDDIPIENEELKEIIDGFNKSTHLLNDTINDLVRVIIIKDNPSIEKESLMLKDIFEDVFSQLDFLIGLHKPIIKFNFKEISFLNTNKSYLESILLNLLTNSIKYKSDSRKLKINITAHKLDDSVVLIFNDNGIGIDLERNKDKIFGLYQRFHDYPDSKGLGLYLVKSQVETMGGTINIESQVNVGTTFTLTFKNK
jgi:PAS domain S-box-containing protein